MALTFTGPGGCCGSGLASPQTKAVVRATTTGRALATLTPLSIPVTPAGTWVSEFTLSPDGSHLAMVSGRGDRLKLTVDNLRAGTERTYRPGAAGNVYATPITENSLSWGADTWWTQVQLTADGQTIIGNRTNRYKKGDVQHLVEVSAQTGKLVRVLNVVRHMASDVEQVHWISPSGRVLIVTDALRGRHHSNAHFAAVDAGMLTGGSLHATALVREHLHRRLVAASGPFVPPAPR